MLTGKLRFALPVLLLLAVAALIAWKAISVGLGRLLLNSHIELAVAVDADSSRAALNLARQALAAPQATRDHAVNVLHQLLRSRPADGRLFRALGQLAGAEEATTERYMRDALALRPADVEANAWMVDHAVSQGDFATAIANADAILRVAPQHAKQIFPILEHWMEDDGTLDAFVATLSKRPPWRQSFVEFIARSPNVKPLFPLAHVIQTMRQSPAPITLDESASIINRLVQAQDFEHAYLLWRSLLPSIESTTNILYNGDFGTSASGAAFDWTIRATPGATPSIDSDGEPHTRALRVRFNDLRVAEIGTFQVLLLQPGRYRLIGETRLDNLSSARGLEW